MHKHVQEQTLDSLLLDQIVSHVYLLLLLVLEHVLDSILQELNVWLAQPMPLHVHQLMLLHCVQQDFIFLQEELVQLVQLDNFNVLQLQLFLHVNLVFIYQIHLLELKVVLHVPLQLLHVILFV